jgi:hypothetical protein
MDVIAANIARTIRNKVFLKLFLFIQFMILWVWTKEVQKANIALEMLSK